MPCRSGVDSAAFSPPQSVTVGGSCFAEMSSAFRVLSQFWQHESSYMFLLSVNGREPTDLLMEEN